MLKKACLFPVDCNHSSTTQSDPSSVKFILSLKRELMNVTYYSHVLTFLKGKQVNEENFGIVKIEEIY